MSYFSSKLLELLNGRYSVASSQIGQMEAHCEMLVRWSRRLNLTAIKSLDDIVERHYCESVALADTLPHIKQQIIDAGSGAGFPGIPIAIIRPQHFLYLVDTDAKKTVFLREATLNLPNCRVVRSTLEDLTQEADWLVSRAVHYRDLLPVAERTVDHIALLLTQDGVDIIIQEPGWDWEPGQKLPWGRQRCILVGHRNVSRGM